MGSTFSSTKLVQCDLQFVLGREGYRAGVTTVEAYFAAGEATKRVRHDGLSGLGVPFKDIVRAEVEALQVCATRVRVDGREPWEFLTKVVEQWHPLSP